MTHHIKIYSGDSLDERQVETLLPEAVFCPPISPGDLLKDIKNNIHSIAILDGYIESEEVLKALVAGIRVYGSSSVGALRAVELESYGMIGTGEIFNMIKNDSYFRHDYLLESLDTLTGKEDRPMSYIDFYFAVRYLVTHKMIPLSHSKLLLNAYQEMHYAERDIVNLKSRFKSVPKILRSLEEIKNVPYRQKTFDGRQLLFVMNSMKEIIQENNYRLNH